MKTRALVVVAVLLMGCPEIPAIDGGTGGGSAGGAATGGGSGGGAATGGGAGGLTLANFCTAQQAANCAKDIRCGAAAQGADCQKLAIPSRSSLINARADCLAPSLRTNIASGLTLFDGAKAQQCLAAIETTQTCTSNFSGVAADPSCNEVFTGTVAQGGTCYGFNECGRGLYCDSSRNLCPGTCRPRIAEGNVATTWLACETGLSESFRSDGGIVCVAPVAPGQSCTPPPGAFLGLPCAGTNACQTVGDGGSTCLPLKTAGQPCSAFPFSECALDTACAPGGDGGTQCIALERTGQACGVNLFCQTGLACVAGRCGALVPANGSCTTDLDCVAGHVCNTGACQPFGPLDAGCNPQVFRSDCRVGLFCNAAGHCETQRTLGASCTGNECNIALALSCNMVTDAGVSSCQPVTCSRP